MSLVNFMIAQTVLLVNLPLLILLHQPYNIVIPVLDFRQFQLFLVPTVHTLLCLQGAPSSTVVDSIDLEADSRRAHL